MVWYGDAFAAAAAPFIIGAAFSAVGMTKEGCGRRTKVVQCIRFGEQMKLRQAIIIVCQFVSFGLIALSCTVGAAVLLNPMCPLSLCKERAFLRRVVDGPALCQHCTDDHIHRTAITPRRVKGSASF